MQNVPTRLGTAILDEALSCLAAVDTINLVTEPAYSVPFRLWLQGAADASVNH
jgi:hypothetical protein